MSLLAERRLACCDVTIPSNNRGLLSKIQFSFEVMAELECDAHRTTSWRICKNLLLELLLHSVERILCNMDQDFLPLLFTVSY